MIHNGLRLILWWAYYFVHVNCWPLTLLHGESSAIHCEMPFTVRYTHGANCNSFVPALRIMYKLVISLEHNMMLSVGLHFQL
ncbi:hypothetical protein EDB19DRAFT_1734952 [Suillus lakei]|nr:hypothetical protein EDB19DRAFT_1734952 [Suillus lakei]